MAKKRSVRLCFTLFVALHFLSCQPSTTLVEVRTTENILQNRYHVINDSVKHGTYLSFYENGVDTFEYANYKMGSLSGKRILFYKNGIPEIEETYSNGRLNGRYRTFYPSGELELQGVYENGVLSGIVKKFYPSGSLKEEVTFVDNIESGPFKEYYENGHPIWSGVYLNGNNEFGELFHYNDQGELIKKMVCDSLAICRTTWSIETGDIHLEPLLDE